MSNDSIYQETTDSEADLSFEDIEAAYLRALEVAEAVEAHVAEIAPEVLTDAVNPLPSLHEAATAILETGETLSPSTTTNEAPLARLSQEQVLEALLFVGGEPLSGRRLADLLGCESPLQVEELIAVLSTRYDSEGRPYQIHLVEGGYEVSLRQEYESVRSRVFGQGPKDVKLSQEVLEILAFIAYKQPVTLADVEATEKKNAGSLVRQLLRRELVELHRGNKAGEETYGTTPRFLQLFGLASLDDLPLAVDFDYK